MHKLIDFLIFRFSWNLDVAYINQTMEEVLMEKVNQSAY